LYFIGEYPKKYFIELKFLKGVNIIACLIPIQYHKCKYPNDIKPHITEVAGHFDISSVNISEPYSLHTEYSFTRREFNNNLVKKYDTICKSNKFGIPMLWHSEEWAKEFADFIKELTQHGDLPRIIEIHPSFSDYSDIANFIDIYKIFEYKIKSLNPDVTILIENRSGTVYSGGKFIISKIDQLLRLSEEIDKQNIDLRITLDIPQLFTAHSISKSKMGLMLNLFDEVKDIRHNINGIHLWGKKESSNGRRIAHIGDLNSYFLHDTNTKEIFLKSMYDTFNDDICRYFVPEVNSGSEDLISIVEDLRRSGFKFV
jgi:hypothetical protein